MSDDTLPPINPNAVERLVTIQMCLSHEESAKVRRQVAGLSPTDIRALLDDLLKRSLPDAIAFVRRMISVAVIACVLSACFGDDVQEQTVTDSAELVAGAACRRMERCQLSAFLTYWGTMETCIAAGVDRICTSSDCNLPTTDAHLAEVTGCVAEYDEIPCVTTYVPRVCPI